MLAELALMCQMVTATPIKKNNSVDEIFMGDYARPYTADGIIGIEKASWNYIAAATNVNAALNSFATSVLSYTLPVNSTWQACRDDGLSGLFTDLALLFQPSSYYHDDFLAPTKFSLTTMCDLLDHASLLVSCPFPTGTIYPDGDGGLRLEWIGHELEMRLIISATKSSGQYIYYEDSSGYSSDFEVTPSILATYLNKFSQYEQAQ